MGGELSVSESDFSGSKSPLSLIALVSGGYFPFFVGVAWSPGATAKPFISFPMNTMVEIIWVIADKHQQALCLRPGAKHSLTRFLQKVDFLLLPVKGGLFHSYFRKSCCDFPGVRSTLKFKSVDVCSVCTQREDPLRSFLSIYLSFLSIYLFPIRFHHFFLPFSFYT